MIKTPQSDERPVGGHNLQDAMNDLVLEQVVHRLGSPEDLLKVQIRPLWEDHYRVNVVGMDVTSARVANSFFLVTDGEGNIVASSPKIVRQY